MKKNMVSIATCNVLYIVFPAHLGSLHFATTIWGLIM